jgi:glycosyltransferase involved in cell wall biosynthesis
MSEKLFIAQPYQEGTSFSEITKSVEKVNADKDLGVKFLKFPYKEKNKLQALIDNPEEISLHAKVIKTITEIDFSHALFLDFFAPGIDTLAFARSIRDRREKLGALLHGGTFLEGDIYKWEWLKKAEETWFEIFDVIYSPSEFLKKSVPDKYKDKVKVFPWGMDNLLLTNNISWNDRNYDVIFPHRLDKDKGIEDLLFIIKSLPQVSFVITIPQKRASGKYIDELKTLANCKIIFGENDEKHFKTLQNSRIIISTAYQENFGYSLMKGVCAGCVPIVPNRLVYPEFLEAENLYNNLFSGIEMIERVLVNKNEMSDTIRKLKLRIKSFSIFPLLKDFFRDE